MSTFDSRSNAVEFHQRTEFSTGPQLIDAALRAIMSTQSDLARLSGLTPNTITALKKGKRPNRAQRAAIAWAVLSRWT